MHPREVILSGWKMPLSPNFPSDAARPALRCAKRRNCTPAALASLGSYPERLKNAAQSQLPVGCRAG